MQNPISIKSLAPILLVDAIEPSLPFWVGGLGFVVTTAVPETAPHAFAIVARDGIEVMLQTRASAADDLGEAVPTGPGAVYISVGALGPVLSALGEIDIAVQRRTTFYGADEIFVRDPGGHLVGLAAPA
jgi:catechol 2,3-dioxygenase-like lactoylglutathione lyase family enzyme